MNQLKRTVFSSMAGLVLLALSCAVGCGGAQKATGQRSGSASGPAKAVQVQKEIRNKFAEAVAAYQAKQLDRAIDLFKEVIEDQPNLGSAYFNIGIIYQAQGQRDQAREWYKKAGDQAKGFVDGLVNIGVMERDSGLDSAAMGTFETVLRLDEFNPVALLNLAQEARARKDFPGAITYVRKSLLANSRNAGAYEVLARIYYDMGIQKGKGFFPLARLVCLSGLEHDNKSPRLHNTLGLVYLGMDDVRSALGSFESAIEGEPTFGPAHINIGAVTFRYRDYKTSYKHFSIALKSEPGNLDAMLSKAVVARALGRIDEAEQGYRSVLSKSANHVGAHFNLGLLYQEHKNQLPQALAQYEKVLSLTQDESLTKRLQQRIQVVKIQIEAMKQAEPQPAENPDGA